MKSLWTLHSTMTVQHSRPSLPLISFGRVQITASPSRRTLVRKHPMPFGVIQHRLNFNDSFIGSSRRTLVRKNPTYGFSSLQAADTLKTPFFTIIAIFYGNLLFNPFAITVYGLSLPKKHSKMGNTPQITIKCNNFPCERWLVYHES